MKKWPMIKRISALVLVLAMVATSAKFDWSAFTLKGKAFDTDTTSWVSSEGSIAQVVKSTASDGCVKQLTSLQIQLKKIDGQTRNASVKIYKGISSLGEIGTVTPMDWGVGSISSESEGYEIWTFAAPSGSEIFLGSNEYAVAVFTLTTTAESTSNQIYYYGNGASTYEAGFKTNANDGGYTSSGSAVCVAGFGDDISSGESYYNGAIAWMKDGAACGDTVWVASGDNIVLTPTIDSSVSRSITITETDASSVATVTPSATVITSGTSLTVHGDAAGEMTLKAECGTASKTITVKVLEVTQTATSSNYGVAVDLTTVFGVTGLTRGNDYTISREAISATDSAGTYPITITGVGTYAGFSWSGNYTVNQIELPAESVFAAGSYTIDVTSRTVTAGVAGSLSLGTDFEVADISQTGTTGSYFTYEITVKGKGNYLESPTRTFSYTYNASGSSGVILDIADVAVIQEIGNQTYTGSKIKPDVTLLDATTGTALTDLTVGRDYEVIYEDDPTDCGTYEVVVNGLGNYAGSSITSEYVISQVPITSDKITISSIERQRHTGEALTPVPTITYKPNSSTSITLTAGQDFKISYSNNTNVGVATYYISGIGNYRGRTSAQHFTIYKDLRDAEITIESRYTASGEGDTGYNKKTYSGTAVEPVVNNVTLGGTILDEYDDSTQTGDYVVDYSDNTNASTKAKVKIIGKNDYANQETFVYFTIKPISVTSSTIKVNSVTPGSVTYTGEAITPTAIDIQYKKSASNWVSLTKYNESASGYKGDYSVEYSNNTDVGTAKATITFTGNYSGTVEKAAFDITALDISNENNREIIVNDGNDLYFTGSAQEPSVVVKTAAGVTIDPENYTITSYSDNKEVGTATVNIRGKNNLTGTTSAPFNIKAKTFIGSVRFTLGGIDYGTPTEADAAGTATITPGDPLIVDYTGSQVYPTEALYDGDTKLTLGKDYTKSFSNNIAASDTANAKVVLKGKGNYSGQTVTLCFKISRKSLGDGTTAAGGITAAKTGSGSATTIAVTDGSKELREGDDYEIIWDGKTSVVGSTYNGTAGPKHATITGIGNYTGSFVFDYDIGTSLADGTKVNLKYGHVGVSGLQNLFEGAQMVSTTTSAVASDFANGRDTFTMYYVGNARPKIVLEANGGAALSEYDATAGTGNYKVSYSCENGDGYAAGSRVTVTVEAVENNPDYYGTVQFTYNVVPFNVSKLSSEYKKKYFTTDEYVTSTDTDDYEYTGLEIEPYGQLKFDLSMSASALVSEGKSSLLDVDKTVVLTKGTDYTIAPTTIGPDSGNTDVAISFTNSNFTNDSVTRKAKIKTGDVSTIKIGPSVNENIRAQIEGKDDDGDTIYTYPSTQKTLSYTGSNVNPFQDGTWSLFFGGKKMNYGTAYSVNYYTAADASGIPTGSEVIPKDAKTYYFTITLSGNFAGEKIYGSFAIKPMEVSADKVTIKIDKDAFTYDTNAHQAGVDFPVEVFYEGNNSAIDSSWYDLTVTYTTPSGLTTNSPVSYKLPGLYTINVQFKDGHNYDTTPIVTKTYKIVGNLDTALIEAKDGTEDLTNKVYMINRDQNTYESEFDKTNIKLYFGSDTLDYDEQYFTVTTKKLINPGIASVTVTGKSPYFTGSRTYQVIAKGYLKDAVVSGWISYTDSANNTKHTYAYTGQTVTPDLRLSYNNEYLTKYTDYTEAYEGDTTRVGSKVFVSFAAKSTGYFVGNYDKNSYPTDTDRLAYYILYDLSKVSVTVTEDPFTYDGTSKQPDKTKVTVKYPKENGSTETLRVDTDYVLSFPGDDYISVGQKILQLDPKPEFSYSTKQVSYQVKAIELTDSMVDWTSGSGSATYTGEVIKPEVTCTDGLKTLTLGTDYKVVYGGASTNKNKYTISEGDTGFNSSKAPYVTVTGTGNYTGTVTKYFTISPKNINTCSIVLTTDKVPYNGGEPVYADYKVVETTISGAERELVKNTDYTVKTTTDAVKVGDPGYIWVEGTGNYTDTLGDNTTPKYEVVKANLRSTSIKADVTETEYTGAAVNYASILTVQITCTKADGSTVKKNLTYPTDYTITYSAGEMKDAGTYAIELSGAGSYEGTVAETFKINPKELALSEGKTPITEDEDDLVLDKYEITFADPNWPNLAYDNGNPVTPAFTIKDVSTDHPGNPYTLQEGTDYTFTYENNTASASKDNPNAAPAIVITGKGNYSDTIKATFNIGTDISAANVSLTPDEFDYNGQVQKPSVVVKKGTETLAENTDYTIEWPDDCTSAGTKTVTVKGTGAYYGSATADYEIHQKTPDLSKITVTPNLPKNSAGYYTTVYPGAAALEAMGGGVKPGVVVYDTEISESVPLVEGTDYTVAYSSNNNKAGDTSNPVVATVTLTGNYEGSYTKTTSFVIEPRSLSDDATEGSLRLDDTAVEWTGNQIKPVETVKDDLGNILTQGTDYTISYGENKEVGDGTVTITGKNNYAGTLEKTFVIYGNLTATTTTITIGDSFYTGDSSTTPTPKPTVVCAGKTLVQTELDESGNVVTEGQFRVTNVYSNDGFTTSGTVVIEAEDQTYYRNGPVTKTFNVVDDISLLKITGVANEYTYTGKAIKPQPVVKDAAGNEIPAASVVYTSGVDGTECVNVGTVTMKAVIATVNSTEEKSITTTYKIVPRNINTCKISNLQNDTYTGSKLYPPVTVVWDGKELASDNCSITYSNNVNPGVADVVIAGKNNFTGSRTLHFTIQAPRMQGVKAYGISDSQLVVMWTRANHVDGYEITYSVNGSTKKATTTSTSYTISGLSASTPYEVKVRTYVTVGGTKYYGLSTSTSGKTFVTTPDYLLTSPAAGMAQLSWSVASSGASGYSIYRSDSANGTFKRIADIPATTTTWTNRNLTSGKTYYYYIQAYQSDGTNITYGAKSVTRSITVK